jgi:radical SAM protein with 4Fe4S-binding SPASM domain
MQGFAARKRLNQLLNRVESRLCTTTARSMPVVVDVVLTKACNLACTFCKDYQTVGAQRVSVQNFEKIAAQIFPTAHRINICSGGEPYLHPGLEDLLRICKRHGLFTWLLSNGTLCREERLRAIVREGLVDEHGFSVDGFKAETVEAIRINASFEKILDSIALLRRIRSEEGVAIPRIVIRYALMRMNVEELPDAIRRWGEMGIEGLECGYLSLANGIPKEQCMFYHQDLLERVYDQARSVAARYPGLKLILPPLIREEREKAENPAACRSPWNFVMIDTNGEVLPCYRAFEVLRMGQVYGENARPFHEIWNSPAYQALRGTVNAKDGPRHYPYCGTCETRLGWGREEAHLGDVTWLTTLGSDRLRNEIDHKRPHKGYRKKTG